MKTKVIIFLLITICILPIFSGDKKRGVTVVIKKLDPSLKIGKQYLVLIAIDKYEKWLSLRNPVKDAKELKNILCDIYSKVYKLDNPVDEAHNTVEYIKYALNPKYNIQVK